MEEDKEKLQQRYCSLVKIKWSIDGLLSERKLFTSSTRGWKADVPVPCSAGLWGNPQVTGQGLFSDMSEKGQAMDLWQLVTVRRNPKRGID